VVKATWPVAPDPAHFDELAARTSAMVHEFPGWTDELRFPVAAS
jgi:hypothetical protein